MSLLTTAADSPRGLEGSPACAAPGLAPSGLVLTPTPALSKVSKATAKKHRSTVTKETSCSVPTVSRAGKRAESRDSILEVELEGDTAQELFKVVQREVDDLLAS